MSNYADRFQPRGEWVLCRVLPKKSTIVRVNGDGIDAEAEYEVIRHGPGEWQHGVFVPVEGLPAGTRLIARGDTCFQHPSWKPEMLFIVPASLILGTMDAAATPLLAPKAKLLA
jgi:hypothetical protein